MIGNTIKAKEIEENLVVLDKINAPGMISIGLEKHPAFFDHYLVSDGHKVFSIPCLQVEKIIEHTSMNYLQMIASELEIVQDIKKMLTNKNQ